MSDALLKQIAQLHEEASEAIRAHRLAAYERALEAYSATLLAFPKAWARYRQRYTREISSGPGPFDLGVLSTIERNLFLEMKAAVRTSTREIAISSTWFPFGVATKAVPLGAIEITSRMLDLIVSLFADTETAPPSGNTQIVSKACVDAVFSFGEYVVRPQDAGTLEALTDACDLMRTVFMRVNDLLKGAVDADNAQIVRDGDHRWSELMQLWNPEEDSSRLERSEGAMIGEFTQAAAVTREVELRRQLDELRRLFRLGLAMWTLRRFLLNQGSRDRQMESFKVFGAHFTDVGTLTHTTSEALASSFDGGPWHGWLLSQLGEQAGASGSRGFSFAGPDVDFLNCYLVLLVRLTDPIVGPLLPATEWLKVRSQDLLQRLEQLALNNTLWEDLGVDAVANRAEQVRLAIEDAALRRGMDEDLELAESDVNASRLEEFRGRVRAGWESNRVLPALFNVSRSTPTETSEAPMEVQPWGINEWVPKGLFVDGTSLSLDVAFAVSRGENISQSEMDVLLDELSRAPDYESDRQAIVDLLYDAIAEMREEEYEPSLIIAPIDSQLWNTLGVKRSTGQQSEMNLPERASKWIRGTIKGIPLLTWPSAPRDVVIIIDFSRLGRLRQWPADDAGNALSVELQVYDEAEARTLVEANDYLFRDAQHTTVFQRATRLRGHVRLRAVERWSLSIDDIQAARRLNVRELRELSINM